MLKLTRENAKPREPSRGRCRPLTATQARAEVAWSSVKPSELKRGGMGSARQASREKEKIEQKPSASTIDRCSEARGVWQDRQTGEEKDMQERGQAERC